MTLPEIEQVLRKDTEVVLPSRIRSLTTTAGGTAHPLWTMVDMAFPPTRPWLELPPPVRGQILNAAKLLHANNIPYGFYVNYLIRARKGGLKHRPMILFASGVRKDGLQQLLREYITVFNLATELYKESADIIRINDVAYNRFPVAWEYGLLKYVHSLTVIKDALKTRAMQQVLLELAQAKTIDDFWNGVGVTVYITQDTPIDLTAGQTNQADVRRLRLEMGIRMGRTTGTPNPTFNKYFKKNGTLSAAGLKVVSGEVILG